MIDQRELLTLQGVFLNGARVKSPSLSRGGKNVA